MSDQRYALGRKPHPETPAAAAAYPITAHPGYRDLSAAALQRRWWWEDGAWLDQLKTGTCVANAVSHRLADSPVPEGGITETTARQLYVSATGDQSLQEGTSALVVCRYLKAQAAISAYHWVTSAEELRNTLLGLGSVCIGIDWFNSMFNPVKRYSQAYLNVDPASGVAGGHEVLVNGYRHDTAGAEPPFYRVKNSWGRSWGNAGTVRVACTDLESLVFADQGDAVLITEVAA